MKNKLSKILIAISIIFFALYFINSNDEIYGNDKESIIDCIKDNSILKDKTNFEIADIIDTDQNTRIVGFFANNSTGVASFIKNKDDNYEIDQLYVHENTKTSYFNIINRNKKYKKFVVVSNGDSLDKVILKVDGKYKESRNNLINKSSVSVFDLPYPKDKSETNIEVQFLDINEDSFDFSE